MLSPLWPPPPPPTNVPIGDSPHDQTQLVLSLYPLCCPQISAWHNFRLFHVLDAVIGASESPEETWEKTFMQLALENMTKTTVGLPLLPPPANRPFHKGFWDAGSCLGDPKNARSTQPCA